MNKKLCGILLILLISLIGFYGKGYAGYGTNHILKGQFKQGVNNLTYWYDTSVGTYSFKNHFEFSIANWNNLSSNVNMVESTNAASGIKIFVGSNNLPPGYAGLTQMYYFNFWGSLVLIPASDVENGTDFDRSVVRIDNQQRQTMGYTGWDKVVKLTGHEIGHTLSMHHFENFIAHPNKNSWMYSSTDTNSSYPSIDDKDHLQHKWGQ